MGKHEIVEGIRKTLNLGLNEPFDIFEYNNEPKVIKIKKKTKYQKWFIIFDGTYFYLVDNANKILARAKSVEKLIPKGMVDNL